MAIADKYHEKLAEVYRKHQKEFKEAYDALEEAARKLGLADEYARIWETTTDPAADLRAFAMEHGLAKEYRDALKKLPASVRTELAEAYSSVWTDDTVKKMRDAGEVLRAAYKALMRGNYEAAARAAGIDVSLIEGIPARDALSIIATSLGIGDKYSEIIGKHAGKKNVLHT